MGEGDASHGSVRSEGTLGEGGSSHPRGTEQLNHKLEGERQGEQDVSGAKCARGSWRGQSARRKRRGVALETTPLYSSHPLPHPANPPHPPSTNSRQRLPSAGAENCSLYSCVASTLSAVRLPAMAFSHSRFSPSSRYWSEA